MALEAFKTPIYSEIYKKYRPTYPDGIYTRILSFMDMKDGSGSRSIALDVGCGSGQNTMKLADYFQHVTGTDISEAAITVAQKTNSNPNVTFRTEASNQISEPDCSVDLVTSAEAAHFFDPIEEFYKEADRVLKPGGVLAMFAYSIPQIRVEGYDSAELSYPIWQMFEDERIQQMSTCGAAIRKVFAHYTTLPPPYEDCNRFEFQHVEKKTIQDVLNYLSSWSRYWKYMEQCPDGDPLLDLVKRYERILDRGCIQDVECDIVRPMFLVTARKPQEQH